MPPEPVATVVRVVDEAGEPIAGAFVTVEWGTAPTPEITQITGADGQIRLALPPGRFRIRAAAKGHGDECAEMDVPAQKAPLIVKLK